MRPLLLELNNFLIYKGVHSIDLSTIQQCTISGINASGKSTLILDSMLFALYGQARQKGAGCISLGETSTTVAFNFSHNNEQYRVIREVKTKPAKMTLEIFRNGENITATTLTENQKFLEEKILGFSKELFLNLCCSVQGQIDSFAQQSPQEKQQLLSELLQYDNWDKKKKLAYDRLHDVQSLKGSITVNRELLQRKSEKLDITIKEKNSLLVEQEKKEQIDNGLKQKLKELQPNIEKIRSYRSMRDQLLQVRNQFITELEKNSVRLASINASRKILQDNDIDDYLYKMQEVKEVIDGFRAAIQSTSREIERLSKLHNTYEQVNKYIFETSFIEKVPCVGLEIHSQCQLLTQALKKREEVIELKKKYAIDNPVKEGKNTLKLLENAQSRLVDDEDELQENVKKLDYLNEQFQNLKIHKSSVDAVDNYDYLIKRNNELSILIKDCSDKLQIQELDNDTEREYKEINIYHENLSKELLIINNKITYANALLTELLNDIDAVTLELEKTKTIEEDEADWKFLINTYDSIPSILLMELVPVIEDEANKILQLLGVDYQMKIVVFQETKTTNQQKKAFDIVYSSGYGEIPFDSLSGSEKFKQALALRIALSKTLEQLTGINIGMFIIDEGFGALDAQGIQDVKTVLEPLANQFNFFCIITHIDEIKDVFSTQIIIHPGEKNKIEILTD